MDEMNKKQKELAVEVKGITKSYPGVVANKSVDFTVNKGEIHALVGENGAGKSTLMKILYGIEQADEGEVSVNGNVVEINKVDTAIKLGIGMVHQEFHLVPSFTAAENIGLGEEPRNSNGLINWDKLNKDVSIIYRNYSSNIDEKQLIKIKNKIIYGLNKIKKEISNKKFEFRDDAIYINSSADGQFDIVADGSVQVDSPFFAIGGSNQELRFYRYEYLA